MALDAQLRSLSGRNGAGLIVLHGAAAEEIPRLAQALDVQAVFAGKDYEPQTRTRDASVQQRLQRQGQTLHLLKDHVVFEEREVLTQAGNPYGVFTPYLRAWLARLMQAPTQEQVPSHTERLAERPDQYARAVPALADIGFESTNLQALRIPTGEAGAQSLLGDFLARMDRYADTRDYPAIKGPSYLSVHLRFGTVSIRQLVLLAHARQLAGDAGAGTWLSELVWREFYVQILANFPHVADAAFKPEYDQIVWEEGPHAEALYQAWCQGKTGYPIVDAAMAQLNQTGYMHNLSLIHI